ncbi:transposase [Thalassomonas viridans]|uniref:Transposase n=1 Tax=Thalassomonas viridans TaxID=137584 RepID=A0AAE9Z5P1_9GAMM|nr:transposase [Thalassomonas viridans]WDE06529.1 transposase [Thalassomonas viridans]
MTRARKEQVFLDETPYYHCICRCVRRAFLCGEDETTGQNFDHRKEWLVDKVTQLASVFAVDICAYAIMSNHYHLVLRVNQHQAKQWDSREVALRWMQLFKGHPLVDRYLSDTQTTQAETDKALELIETWRKRLFELGWFMRCLNEHIAVQANKEDNCKGRFWEGRFKSQALLDDTALLACMAYVDLNPVRAAIADTPESSDFTSIQLRIKALAGAQKTQQLQPSQIVPFTGYKPHGKPSPGLPFKLFDYLTLVEWTGRCVREDKRGFIPPDIQPLFERLNINEEDWLMVVKDFNRHFINAAGSPSKLRAWAGKSHSKWCCTHMSLQLYAG